jgi:simple sugar transport system ATP-binding protein
MMSYVLEAREIMRHYGQVEALRECNFTVKAGEVTALIGDNGAGKSTLVRILSGTEQPDSGEIIIDGKATILSTPAAAREAGIETVFQDLALCPHLNAVQNMYLGREISRGGI